MAKHECSRDGDNIPKIAKERGLRDWKKLWDENKGLQKSKKRSNPMVLFTGDKKATPDKITLPKKKKGKKGQASSAHAKYVVPVTEVALRLRVLKGDFTALADRDFELEVKGLPAALTGKTDADGRIKVAGDDPKIPVEATSGKLTVQIKPEDVGADEEADDASGGDGSGGDGSADAAESEEAIAGVSPVIWELKISQLNPIDQKAPNSKCLSGVQQRLNNLGLNAGPVDGINGANTKAAVEAFQSLFGLKVDGKAGKKTQPKLHEVHDTEGFAGPAPGTLEIKHPVPESKKLEISADDVGFVCPDLTDAATATVNALVIRPTYRISLKLGDIDALCPEEPNTPEGRRRRLQLLGYLYEKLTDATAVAAGNTVWTWYTTELTKTDATLADQLVDEIVDGGELPAEGEFKRIRVPGGYCYNRTDSSAALRGTVVGGNHAKFNREKGLWDDNSVLGAIPIIAKVESKTGDDAWSPASDVTVYLQLQKPDDLVAADKPPAMRDGTSLFTPAPASSPEQFVVKKIANYDDDPAHVVDPDDPQVDNAHSDVGGKRTLPVADNVFEINAPDGSPRKGFHVAHDARPAPDDAVYYPQPEAAPVDGDKHKHAVRASTNANGEAGFIFKPARTGGDRYKLRAYIGPETPGFDGNDGTGVGAVRVDTGTFVMWRRLRFSRNLFWNYQGAAPAAPAATTTWADRMQYRVAGGLPSINMANVGNEFAKGYQDVVVETTGARTEMTAAQWTAARNFAVGQMAAAFPTIDFAALIPTVNNTMFVINLVSRTTYNANKGAAFPNLSANNTTYWQSMAPIVSQFKDLFMQHFTQDALPFTVIHCAFGDSLTYNAGPVPSAVRSSGFLTTSGVASPVRGAFVFWASTIYQRWTYPRPTPITANQGVDANTAHESGHCHYGPHHWTARSTAGVLSGGFPADHDQKDYCVMGYVTMEGDFCGRCILKHRGWNVVKLSV